MLRPVSSATSASNANAAAAVVRLRQERIIARSSPLGACAVKSPVPTQSDHNKTCRGGSDVPREDRLGRSYYLDVVELATALAVPVAVPVGKGTGCGETVCVGNATNASRAS